MSKADDIKAKIAELQKDLAAAELEEVAYKNLSLKRKIAILLHKNLCHYNHIDGCGWEYGSDYDENSWLSGGERSDYVLKARRVVTSIKDFSTVVQQGAYNLPPLKDEDILDFVESLMGALK